MQTAPPPWAATEPDSTAQRWELLRALGATVLTPPPGNAGPCAALGLPAHTGAEHTQVFVLSAPPHAAIHLGPEGMLGGEGLDRITGFWRALGLTAPADADHLGALLLLYAELGEAECSATDAKARAHMRRARTALFHEHLWSWAPGYLAAVADLQVESTTAWAQGHRAGPAGRACRPGPRCGACTGAAGRAGGTGTHGLLRRDTGRAGGPGPIRDDPDLPRSGRLRLGSRGGSTTR